MTTKSILFILLVVFSTEAINAPDRISSTGLLYEIPPGLDSDENIEDEKLPSCEHCDQGRIHYSRTIGINQKGDLLSYDFYAACDYDSGSDMLVPLFNHYEAILFYSETKLSNFLKTHDVNGCTLIDMARGKQFVVHQEAIRDTVTTHKLVTRGWKYTISKE